MLEFTVGKDFPLGDCRGKEGFFFDYGETGIASLTIVFKHMRPLEVDLITREHGRIGLFMYSGIIFVSCKFGRIDGDNAYTVHLHERPEEIFVPKAEEGTGIPLHIFAVESTNNVLLGLRVCGMSSKWTNELGRMIDEQKKLPFSYEEYRANTFMCHNRWSSKDLLRMGTCYKLGASEAENPFEVIRGGKA